MTTGVATQITLNGPGLQSTASEAVAVGQQLDITISVSARIGVDGATARRIVAGWLVSQVGNLLAGDEPALFIGRRAVWRVPALLTSPSRGVVGQVGTVDVDAETGELLADLALAQRLQNHAHQLVRSPSPSAA